MLKSLLLRTVPDRLLFEAKKLHYVRVVRRFSPPCAPILRALVPPGSCALDLGANVGWYSRVLSELVGPPGRVYSVEPVPPTFALLTRCLRKLRLTNVETINAAVSDRRGVLLMEVPPWDDGGDNFYQAHVIETETDGAGRRRFRVATLSVDEICATTPNPVRFIKCDVEGHEWPALRGAAAVIARWRPAMLVEVTSGDPDRAGTRAHDLVAWLGESGYRTYRFTEERLVARRSGDRSVDYFFLTDDHLAQLRAADVRVG
jgi:FkbM family methyltransferase